MKTIILSALFVGLTNFMTAQNLTQTEALTYVDELVSKEILSEKGKDFFRQIISENAFERDKGRNPINGETKTTTQVSKTQLLLLLANSFGSEFYFRSGIIEQNKLIKQTQEKKRKPLTEADYEKLDFNKAIEQSEAYKIESAIKDDEHFSEEAKSFALHPLEIPAMDGYGYIHNNRSAVGKQCTKTLNDLFSIGLIDSTIYQETLEQVKNNKLVLETYVVSFTAERARFYEDFAENKEMEITFISGLKDLGVLSGQSMKELVDSYKGKELKNKFDYLDYCNNARVFNVPKYDTNPAVGYSQIFQEIKILIPDLQYTNFKFSLYKNEKFVSDLEEIKGRIEFDADGNHYTNTFFYDFIKKVPDNSEPKDTLLKISNEFHKAINRWLADRNSSQRLYYANKPDERSVYGSIQFGLILLTNSQANAWGNDAYFLSQESHENNFNSQGISETIKTYDSLGLFVHLSPTELAEGKQKALAQEISSYGSILSCFPKTIVVFDWESGNLENPYEELTTAFSMASRGAFVPSQIVDKFEKSMEKPNTPFSFKMNNKLYKKNLKVESDWLDPAFLELIHTAMQENKIDGKFYYCINNGQESGYIFLTKKQHDFLRIQQPSLFSETSD